MYVIYHMDVLTNTQVLSQTENLACNTHTTV